MYRWQELSLAPATFVRSLARKLGADSDEQPASKKCEDNELLRSIIQPLEMEITALKNKLRENDAQLQEALKAKAANTTNAATSGGDAKPELERARCDMCANYEQQLVAEQARADSARDRASTHQHALALATEELEGVRSVHDETIRSWQAERAESGARLQQLAGALRAAREELAARAAAADDASRRALHTVTTLTVERETLQGKLDSLERDNAMLIGQYTKKALEMQNEIINLPDNVTVKVTNPKSYRPISLTSVVLKTLERLCERELRENYLQKIPLHPNQHAYCQGKCTDSALQAVVSVIESALSEKCFCLGIFLDIEGAFDKTKFTKIKDALHRHGVCNTLKTWTGNMLQHRIILMVEGESQRAMVAKGCPQGGVISPLLWNMVVNDLIAALNDNYYYTVGYADDLAILIRGKFVNTICEVTNAALKIVEQWCGDNGLSVNPSKTELVMFKLWQLQIA
ncbi:unnamed protein product [Euphydryas editha]|uniref:Reverse transcriptase domain-containing protein n=1 Tax=Euphydryas editha TaxID=104508 RepID=A0AAU9UCS2_EUPED|nr:unnamed protein product [Euphydryas editha]